MLQSGKQDDLVEEVPTFIAKAYPEEHDYPPLERPYAIQQWVEQADIPEQYVFLADPDHIFLRPLPNLMGSDMRPVGFRFWYMRPAKVGACTPHKIDTNQAPTTKLGVWRLRPDCSCPAVALVMYGPS